MNTKRKGCTGIRVGSNLWLSPLPLLPAGNDSSLSLFHKKDEACLSLVIGMVQQLEKIQTSWLIAVPCSAIIIALLLKQGIFEACVAILGLSVVCLFEFLIFKITNEAKKYDFPILFHRQKREVMFLEWNDASKRVESRIVPWEQLAVRIETTPEGQTSSSVSLIFESDNSDNPTWPEKPGRTYVFQPPRGNEHLNLAAWRSICRYMNGASVPAEEGAEEWHARAMASLIAPLPQDVLAWMQPIPQEEWARPSVVQFWYDSYLQSFYQHVRPLDFTETGSIEELIPYPGDEEALAQLKEGVLVPAPTEGQPLPALPAYISPAETECTPHIEGVIVSTFKVPMKDVMIMPGRASGNGG